MVGMSSKINFNTALDFGSGMFYYLLILKQAEENMKTQFDGEFYTDDFDQEMIDFIEQNLPVSNIDWHNKTVHDIYLKYSHHNKCFWFSDDSVSCFKRLTKQQFKEKIGMTTKQFTKSDLKDGMRVVHRDKTETVVVGCELWVTKSDNYFERSLHMYSGSLLDDLKSKSQLRQYDIMEVIDRDNTVLFKRVEKSQTQLQLEELEKQQREIADKIAELSKKL